MSDREMIARTRDRRASSGEGARGRPHDRRGGRFERFVALATGALFLGAGLWAFLGPASFFETAATFEPYNVHLIRDLGAFQIGLGAVLVLAVLTRDALMAALAGVGAGAVFHLVGHVIDRDLGGDPAVDLPFFGVTAVLLVGAALARARTLRR